MEIAECRVTDTYALQSINLCKNCSKTLNVPPVYCIEYPNGLITEICGRCYHIVYKHEGNKWRQHAYENIAQYLTYPCVFKNQGCDTILKWNEVIEHESNCTFPVMSCPANDNDFYVGFFCPWEDKPELLADHLQSFHETLFVSPPHFEEFPKTSEVFFTKACDTIFMIVFLRHDENKYSCCVLVRGGEINSQLYRYQVELMDSSKTNSIILRRNRLVNWLNVESALCDKNNLLEIDYNVIQNLIKHNPSDKRISARFGIVKKSKKETKHIYEAAGLPFSASDSEHRTQSKLSLPDDKLLSELECPVCNEYMVPPIYICSNGHSLCNECLTKVQSCPNCRCPLGNTRNFTLENLTTKVIYPCKNKEAGCVFVTTSENIREHENSCNLTTLQCPLKCGASYRKPKLWPHITSKHPESILEMCDVHKRDIHDKKESHHIVYTSGEMFRVSIKGSINTNYRFNIQWIGEDQSTPKYKFTLEIIDRSPYKLNITTVSLVQSFNDTPFKTNTITFPWEMLKPFVVENTKYFCFKYNIAAIKFDKNEPV